MDRRRRPANDTVVTEALASEFPELTPVAPQAFRVVAQVLDLSLSPGGARDRQLLYGTAVDLLEMRDGWAFVHAPEADYAGWVDAAQLAPATVGTRHRVATRQTHAYSEPDFKSPELFALSNLAHVSVEKTEGRFTKTELGWVPSAHLSQAKALDPVAEAEKLLGTPYLWGGNSAFGIDCSGLVQNALRACGVTVAGDSDLQAAEMGETLSADAKPERGDLMFWKGHVAWVADGERLLHANAFHMAVTFEPIADAIARIEAQGDGPVTRHARYRMP